MTEQPGRRRPPTTGPRGGRTTVTKSGLVRKTFALHLDAIRALCKAAYVQERTETYIVRTALRRYLHIEDSGVPGGRRVKQTGSKVPDGV